jgi:hypothetical protein
MSRKTLSQCDLIGLISVFVFIDECLYILAVDEHLPADLDIGELTVPDLTSPEPLGCAYFDHELFDRIEPFSGHILGTVSFNHLIFLPYISVTWIANPCAHEYGSFEPVDLLETE